MESGCVTFLATTALELLCLTAFTPPEALQRVKDFTCLTESRKGSNPCHRGAHDKGGADGSRFYDQVVVWPGGLGSRVQALMSMSELSLQPIISSIILSHMTLESQLFSA